jgi:thiamine-monophosphate kinase
MSDTVASVGEHGLIARLRTLAGASPSSVVLGIGDDAAVLEPARGMLDVLTTDSLVEGVHFRREWTSAAAIGHKALAVNLSDLAAMGAAPRASLLSLALPVDFPLADFDALVGGFVALASASGAALVGGNLTRSPGPLVVDVTAVGGVGRRRMLRRDGARPGDELYVTGRIGAAAAGLAMLQAGQGRDTIDAAGLQCVERYERPQARTRCGHIAGRTRSAAAAMDLSDGLADAARQMARASGVGVVLQASALPIHEGAAAWTSRAGVDPVSFALAGGEDYELAFAVRPRLRSRFLAALRRGGRVEVCRVGLFVAEPGEWLDRQGRREPLGTGFDHF